MDILKNEIKIKENDETTLEIDVVKKATSEIIDTVLIDNNDEIKEMILKRSWFVNDDNYAMTKIDKNFVYMHQLIWGYYFGDDFIPRKESQKVIDHLNNNHFDNRIRNLHILTENQNKNKKLIDANFDNLSVYVDYDYSQNISEVKEKQLEKEIYKNRKYVISYISENMIFHTNKENDQFFNSFELVYDDYKKFIEDAKRISYKTQKIRKCCKYKKITEVKLEVEEVEELKNVIENIFKRKNWIYIRNKNCNIVTQEGWKRLTEEEKLFLMTINRTVFQYLPSNKGGQLKK